jgi:hypothetical protein
MFETRAPGARFTRIGEQVDGIIVDARRTQHTEYKTNIPLYWQDKQVVNHPVNLRTGLPNDPKLQYEITIDTGKQDENGITERRLFVRGKRMENALREAVVAGGGGRDGLLIGGHLSCAWTGTEPSTGGGQDAKLYSFTYRPPAAGEGRKPDMTPVLAAGAGAYPDTASIVDRAGLHGPAPTPEFALRKPQQQQARPVVTPYAPAAFSDEPPF